MPVDLQTSGKRLSPEELRAELELTHDRIAALGADRWESHGRLIDGLTEYMQDGFALLSPQGFHLDVNSAFCAMTGFSHEELVGVGRPHPYWSPEEMTESESAMRRDLEGAGETVEATFMRKDGERFPVLLTPSVIRDRTGRPLCVFTTIKDITLQRQAEAALRESETRYRSLFQDSPVAIWVEDHSAVKARLEQLVAPGVEDVAGYLREHPDEYERCLRLARTLDANRAAVSLLEAASREELIARQDDCNPSGSVGGLADFWAAMLAGEASASYEETNLSLLGKEIRIFETCTVVPGHEETFDRVYIADIDISERSRAEAALRASEELLRQSQSAAHLGHYVLDVPSGNWTSSATLDAVFGIDAAFVRNVEGWSKVLHPDQRDELLAYLEERVSRGRPFDREYRIVRIADGAERWVHGLGEFERDADGRVSRMFGIIQDVTERRLAEDEVHRHVERLQVTLEGAVQAMGQLVDSRDPYTGNHERRVAELASEIATRMGWSHARIAELRTAALIHDVGKNAVPTEILSRPGRLTEIEFALIKVHAQVGHDIIAPIGFGGPVADIVLQHHERLDGSGYPGGLRGDEILPAARVLAVADVVEAMGSHRPYRPALPISEAIAELEAGLGTRYDAEAAGVCLGLLQADGLALPE